MLDGRRLLITGVVSEESIAFAVARRAQDLGAQVVLSAFPRDIERARAAAASLPADVPVVPCDLTVEDDVAALRAGVAERWDALDGALHAVAFAPRAALAGDLLAVPASDLTIAFQTSCVSFAALGGVLRDLAPPAGGALVGLDFDAAGAWPVYNWMGVCKAALEAASRYAARDLGARGIRSNLIAAGPIHTRAAGGIPEFGVLLDAWERQAPLTWDARDTEPVADAACFLFSDLRARSPARSCTSTAATTRWPRRCAAAERGSRDSNPDSRFWRPRA